MPVNAEPDPWYPAAATEGDPRPARHAVRRARIVEAAWDLARRRGLQGFGLRELASAVGLRQPSLYSYFASKNELYDAMFAAANEALLEAMASLELPAEPSEALKAFSRALARFSLDDPVRNQLMFQRTLPGFEPSERSYAVAVRFYEWAAEI